MPARRPTPHPGKQTRRWHGQANGAVSTAILAMGMALTAAPRAQACLAPSQVSGTAWVPATSTLCGGDYDVQSLKIPSGVTVNVQAGASISISSVTTIEIAGTLSADFSGSGGGAGCASTSQGASAGSGSGGGAAGTGDSGAAGKGGTLSGAGSPGSGGGGGACDNGGSAGGAGAAGGGNITLIAREIQIDATAILSAAGQNAPAAPGGGGGGGGGGSGGSISIRGVEGVTLTSGATIRAPGGNGGAGSVYGEFCGALGFQECSFSGTGGQGGGGGQVSFVSPASCPVAGSFNVAGGSGGVVTAYTLQGLVQSWTYYSVAGAPGGTGPDEACEDAIAAHPLSISSVTASPNPVAAGNSTTVTATVNNPNGYLVEYQFDCTGTGNSYQAATTSNTVQCPATNVGSLKVLVKVADYNSVTFVDGAAPGTVPMGDSVAPGSVTVTVTDPGLAVVIGSVPSPIFPQVTTASFTATASDNLSGTAAPWVANGFGYTFDFGDMSAPVVIMPAAGNTNVNETHTYASSGMYTLTVTVTDSIGGSANSTAVVAVTDPMISVTMGTIPSPNYSTPYSVALNASATSASSTVQAAGFMFVFNFGDGTMQTFPRTAGTTSASATHVYPVPCTCTFTVTAQDMLGDIGTATTSVTVLDPGMPAPPMVTLTTSPSNGTVPVGQPVGFTAAIDSPNPPNNGAPFGVTWNFGDMSATVSGSTANPPGFTTASEQYTYADPGSYTVELTVTDQEGLSTAAMTTVMVTAVAPTVDLGANRTVPLDTPISLSASVSDPAANDTYTYAWDLGDGTMATTPIVANKTYTTINAFTVTLTVMDMYGATGTGAVTITIVDLPPTASAVTISPSMAYVGTALTLSYTYSDPEGNPQSGTTIKWLVNGTVAPQWAGVKTIPACPTGTNCPTSVGQTWQAQVTPSDGTVSGMPALSNIVTIGTLPPSVTNVTISPADPLYADTLTAEYNYSDPESLPESGSTLTWIRNGTVQTVLANMHSVPPPQTRGDVWVVTVTPSNGVVFGAPRSSAPVTIGDTPPIMGALPNITVTTTGTSTPVTWTVTATDVDGSALTFKCYSSTTNYGAGPTYSQGFPVGTTPVTCTASDGIATVSETFDVIVMTNPPTVTLPASATMNPGPATLTAMAHSPSGGTLSYAWSAQGPAGALNIGTNGPTVSLVLLAAGAYNFSVTVMDGMGSATARTTLTVNALPPIANAGPSPRSLSVGDTVAFDGIWSSDPNGESITYAWSISGSAISIAGATTSPVAQITGMEPGVAAVKLTVTAGGLSASADVIVYVYQAGEPGTAPVADAGDSQTVAVGTVVVLDGSGSYDPGERALGYEWSELSGPSVTLSTPNAVQSGFTASSAGTYVVQLTVSDGNLSGQANVTITAVDAPAGFPVATISPSDTTVQSSAIATLDGSGSSDPNGNALTYAWSLVSGPYAILSGSDLPKCSVTTISVGEIVVHLTVSDGTLTSAPAFATVRVTTPGFRAPTASATGPGSVMTGVPVVLDGSGSTDPNGFQLEYAWTQTSGPGVPLYIADEPKALFTPAVPGAYGFNLTVDDGVFTASAQVQVTVTQGAVTALTAVITGPAVAYAGDPVTLDGTALNATEATTVQYSWSQTAGPPLTISDTTADITFTPFLTGTYVFRLEVADANVTSMPVTWTVNVQPDPLLRGGGGCTSVSDVPWWMLAGLLVRRRKRLGRN